MNRAGLEEKTAIRGRGLTMKEVLPDDRDGFLLWEYHFMHRMFQWWKMHLLLEKGKSSSCLHRSSESL